jgi:hypothetical protein
MITELILANADKLVNINIQGITGRWHPTYGKKSQPSFFLRREHLYSYTSAKENGVYRHCKPYKGHFLDYIVQKEFATLEEWVADAGDDMSQVLFGYQKFDGADSYVTLDQLEDFLNPLPSLIPQVDEMDDVTRFMNRLQVDNLGLQNLLVITRRAGVQSYTQYMEIQ